MEAPPSAFRSAGLKAVKAVHTLAWFSIEAAMVYVLYAGIRGRSDRKAGIAGAVVFAETAIFAGNGFHCPLTAVAQRLGDASGSVTDIYLPGWFARNLPAIHVPLIVLAVALHWRNLRPRVGSSRRRGARRRRTRQAAPLPGWRPGPINRAAGRPTAWSTGNGTRAAPCRARDARRSGCRDIAQGCSGCGSP